MLLKRRSPPTEANQPVTPSPGFEHLDPGALNTLRWLKDRRVEFVLVGAVAEAVQRRSAVHGPVAIAPAPYRRNLERLAGGLAGARVRIRGDRPVSEMPPPTQITAESLTRAGVWELTSGSHHIDIVGTGTPAASGTSWASGYQELLYEANRFELSPGLAVEVASPEDIEHYAHLRRTGTAPEIRISRQSPEPPADTGPAPKEAPAHDSLPGSG